MTCIRCGQAPQGTTNLFTVCDTCWEKQHQHLALPTALEWRVAILRLLEVPAGEIGSLGEAFEQAIVADDLTDDGKRASAAYLEVKRLLEAS